MRKLLGRVKEFALRLFRAARAAPVVTIACLLGLGLVGVLAVFQIASLTLPIWGFDGHHWRQSFTFGVAWNYAHTTHDVLRPRMFLELQKSNIVAMEPPVYPLLASVFLRLNDSTLGGRLLSLLSLVAIAGVLFRMLGMGRAGPRDAWADRAGLLVALGVSPMINTDFHSYQPEPMAAGLAMLAAWFFIRYRDSERLRHAILGAVFTTFAILTKPLVLGIVPGLVLFAVWGPGRWFRRGLITSAFVVLGLAVYAAWDPWASYLLRTEMNGRAIISIQHEWTKMVHDLVSVDFEREAFFHFLPNYVASWWLTPALFAGVFRALSDPRLRRFGVPFGLWLIGYLFELLAFGERLHSNAYYFILAPAPVAFFCAVGVGGFVRALESSKERPPLTVFRIGLALAILLPLGFVYARASNWSSIEHSDLGFERNRHVWTDDFGVARMMIGLLVAIAIGPRLRPRRVPRWAAIPILLGVFASGLYAVRDANQYFRYYASIGKRWHANADIAEIRQAVDRYSRKEDRIVTNSEKDEMVVFYYALRNGFQGGPLATPETLAAARARGARLYFHVDAWPNGPDTPSPIAGEPLARGTWWRLYCIDPAGCGS